VVPVIAAGLVFDARATAAYAISRGTGAGSLADKPDPASWLLRGTITARGNTAPVELTIIEASTNPSGLPPEGHRQGRPLRHDITKLKGMAARYLTLNITARAGRI